MIDLASLLGALLGALSRFNPQALQGLVGQSGLQTKPYPMQDPPYFANPFGPTPAPNGMPYGNDMVARPMPMPFSPEPPPADPRVQSLAPDRGLNQAGPNAIQTRPMKRPAQYGKTISKRPGGKGGITKPVARPPAVPGAGVRTKPAPYPGYTGAGAYGVPRFPRQR